LSAITGDLRTTRRFPLNLGLLRPIQDDVIQTNVSTRRKFSSSVIGALKTLARRTGCSLHQHPMPELREVGREWRQRADSARPSA
jgi:hypothetical protein